MSCTLKHRSLTIFTFLYISIINIFSYFQDPQNPAHWVALGYCLWKKGDLPQARQCLMESLAQGDSVEALQELSMLSRQMLSGRHSQQDTDLLEESVSLAKRAVLLDPTNHRSWYMLGAYRLST